MKPIREWLKELPQDIYDRIKVYEGTGVQSYHWDNVAVESLSDAVMYAIKYRKTTEGDDFWCNVCDGDYDQARKVLATRQMSPDIAPKSVSSRFYPTPNFIELTYTHGKKISVSVRAIEYFESYRKGCLVTVSGNHIEFQESYETVKELIRQATQ